MFNKSCFCLWSSVEYLDWSHRKDWASFWAIKLAAQQPQRSKQLLPQTGIIEYFPDFAISEKITGSESCIIATVYIEHSQNLQNRLWSWSRELTLKWSVAKSHKNFAVTDNIPKFSWEVYTEMCFRNVLMNPLWKLTLCPYWAYSSCKFRIPELNWSL